MFYALCLWTISAIFPIIWIMIIPSKYQDWEQSIPDEFKNDSLWKMRAYRLGLFVSDLAWHDVLKIKDARMYSLSDQLYRATGSISANLAEGYSRGSRKDRARFYEYSLGSARESRDWYFKSRHILSDVVFQHRIKQLTEIIRLLLTMIPQQREVTIREEQAEYITNSET